MKSERFQAFIDQLHHARASGDLADALTGFLESWGIEKFAYLGFPPQGTREPVWLTTYPNEWARHYESKRYETIDPVVATMRTGVMPFFWSETAFRRDITPAQRRFFGEASEFGVRSGLTVPIHDGQGGIAAVSLASNQGLKTLKRVTSEDLSRLHIAALYFHVHARQKLEAIIEQERPHLSPREIACLQWLALGKTMWDVGEILGISRRTVVFHVENAKLKLNAVTLPQAVAQALARQIIEL